MSDKSHADLVVRFMSGIYGFNMEQAELIADYIVANYPPAEQPDVTKSSYPDAPRPKDIHEPRLAPLDQQLVREELIKAGVKPHIAGALSSILCLKFGTSQLEALDREKIAAELWIIKGGEKANEDSKVMIMEECYREADFLCAKFAQPKEVKVSVEDIAKLFHNTTCDCRLPIDNIVTHNLRSDDYIKGAQAILNFLNAKGKL